MDEVTQIDDSYPNAYSAAGPECVMLKTLFAAPIRGIALSIAIALSTMLGSSVYATEDFCPDNLRKNKELARKIKEDLKAEARKMGVPERLMYLYDQLGDCLECLGGNKENPIGPVILIDFVDNDNPAKPDTLMTTSYIMREWTADAEYNARQGMREGYVKGFYILLEVNPCECCTARTKEEFLEWDRSEPDHTEDPNWDEDLHINPTVTDAHTDPDSLGDDPPDLTELPPDTSEWDMTIWPDLRLLPVVRPMTTLCPECYDVVRQHNDLVIKINSMRRPIAKLIRRIEIGLFLERRLLRKIRRTELLADTELTEAQNWELQLELGGFVADSQANKAQLEAALEQRRQLLEQLSQLKEAVRACEKRCLANDAQPLPSVEPPGSTDPGSLPPYTRIASQVCQSCQPALATRNTLARLMNDLVTSMAGSQVTVTSLSQWNQLRSKLAEANTALQTCIKKCTDADALDTGFVQEDFYEVCPAPTSFAHTSEVTKEQLKSAATAAGVPKELLYLYDSLPDCAECLRIYKEDGGLPKILVEVNGRTAWFDWNERSVPVVTSLFIDGVVKNLWVTLEAAACECCADTDRSAEIMPPTIAFPYGLNPLLTVTFDDVDEMASVFDIEIVPGFAIDENFGASEPDVALQPPIPNTDRSESPPEVTLEGGDICEECQLAADAVIRHQSALETIRAQLKTLKASILERTAELSNLEEQHALDKASLADDVDFHDEYYKNLGILPHLILFNWHAKVGGSSFHNPHRLRRMNAYVSRKSELLSQIEDLQQQIRRLETREAPTREALVKAQITLEHCVATHCGQRYRHADTLFFMITDCDACRERAAEMNAVILEWYRNRESNNEIYSRLKQFNPRFTEDELWEAFHLLRDEAKNDRYRVRAEWIKELRACEKRRCANAEDNIGSAQCLNDLHTHIFDEFTIPGQLPPSCQGTSFEQWFSDEIDGALDLRAFDRSSQLPPLHLSAVAGSALSWGLDRVFPTPLSPPAASKFLDSVTVAVIDSGIDLRHPALREKIWVNPNEIPDNGIDDDGNGYIDDIHGWNFVAQSNRISDTNGHGTLVAGIIAAADSSTDTVGVNPNAQIMSLKVTNLLGLGHSVDIARAVDYAVAQGAQVINISLGGQAFSQPEYDAIVRAIKRDVVVIVAAGNEAIDVSQFWPAAVPDVITVAATDTKDNVSAFSNYGDAVDIAAPGVDIVSARARDTDLMFLAVKDYQVGANIVGPEQTFYRASGTSFAAPFVAGTASLLMSQRPNLRANEIKRIILNSADDIESPGVDQRSGYGLLNAAASLAAESSFFIEAEITGIAVKKFRRQPAVQVLGIVAADAFESAEVFIGQGTDPGEWAKVVILNESVRDGELAIIPASDLQKDSTWTLRVVVHHRNSKSREARFLVNLN